MGRATRHHQGPGGVLPEAQGKEGAVGQLGEHQVAHVGSGDPLEYVEHRLVTLGKTNQDAVIVVQTLRAVAESLLEGGFHGESQAEVEAAAVRA